jgi:hypothetical protein
MLSSLHSDIRRSPTGDRMNAFTSGIGTFETCRWSLRMSAYQGRPEVPDRLPKRRF